MTTNHPLITVKETKPIPIDKIQSGNIQVRTKNVEINIDSLAKSLNKFGLINPITVYEKPEGFELIAGQRRLNAAKMLNWVTIRATIIEKPSDEIISKAVSFIENELREKMVSPDVMNTCEQFYFKYGNMKMVSEELGLPYDIVRDSVKLIRAPKVVQEAVKNGDIGLQVAMRATDALKWDSGEVESGEKVLELAREIEGQKMSRDEITAIKKEAETDPSRDVDEIIKKSRNKKKVVRKIQLLADEDESLQEYATKENMNEDDAAAQLVIQGLTDAGYHTK